MIDIALQNDYQDTRLPISTALVEPIIMQTLMYFDKQNSYEIGIACVDCDHSQQLNAAYRHKDKPTNVLSFLSDIDDAVLAQLDSIPLGDLVICIPIVLKEADEQHKTPREHFTHLLVHGILHLLGFDHETSTEDAETMEAIEIAILAQLNIANPYIERTDEQGVF